MATSMTKLRHHYVPRGSALELFKSKAPEVLLSGPAGTGKSRACLEKLLLCALVNPGMAGLIVRKTATSLRASVLKAWREEVLTEALLAGDVEYYGGSAQEPAQYRFTNGSIITFAGMDQYTRIMSTQFDMIFVNEATELEESDWQALTTRLRNGRMSFQQLLADCNPSYPSHWLKKRSDRGTTQMFNTVHQENPRYYDTDGSLTERGKAYINGVLGNMIGVQRERLLNGVWAAAEGLIYDMFSPSKHIVTDATMPRIIKHFAVGVDYGTASVFAAVALGLGQDGRLYLTHEYTYDAKAHQKQLTDEQYFQALQAWMRENDIAPDYIIVDPSASSFITQLYYHTIAAHKGDNKVEDGIRVVASLLASDRLRIHARCTRWLDEVVGYSWDQKASQAGTDKVVKRNDHALDASRYAIKTTERSWMHLLISEESAA